MDDNTVKKNSSDQGLLLTDTASSDWPKKS